jgi:hypothetical protein
VLVEKEKVTQSLRRNLEYHAYLFRFVHALNQASFAASGLTILALVTRTPGPFHELMIQVFLIAQDDLSAFREIRQANTGTVDTRRFTRAC